MHRVRCHESDTEHRTQRSHVRLQRSHARRGLGADTAKIDLAEGDGFLATLLDVINPLQHIPVVGSLYREITGDEISQAASIAGGALFGGPIGLASATANAIFEQASGNDLMGHAVALFTDGAPDPLLQADAGDAVPNATGQTQVATLAPLPEQPGTFVVAGQPALAAHARQAAPPRSLRACGSS